MLTRMIFGLMALMISFPCVVPACSLRPISFFNVQPDFDVIVTHHDLPIEGIEVRIRTYPETKELVLHTTDDHGQVDFSGLAPGKYQMIISLSKIEAGSEWIEVVDSGNNRKTHFEFGWANDAITSSRVSGTLTGLVLGNSGNKLQDVIHPRRVPHPYVHVELINPFDGSKYRTISDATGNFIIEPVPEGIYKLLIGGGTPSMIGAADTTTLVVEVSKVAERNFLSFQLSELGCGEIGYKLSEESIAHQ